jgi:chromosome segregation ATPase
MVDILVAVLFGGLYVGALVMLSRYFERKTSASASETVDEVQSQITLIDGALEQALPYVEEMRPLSEAAEREKSIEELAAQLETENAKLAELDKKVESLQADVEVEEASHNELKKGKDDATLLAEELRAGKEALDAEAARLQADLEQSLQQLQNLSGEIEMTAEQQAALNKIGAALESARGQFASVTEIHSQAQTRFFNLEHQYLELEKEFTKLVERELSGG